MLRNANEINGENIFSYFSRDFNIQIDISKSNDVKTIFSIDSWFYGSL